MTPRLKEQYQEQISKKLADAFGIKNSMALPKLDKIIVSVGVGKQLEGSKLNPKAREQVITDLAMITGQQPVMRKAKKAVSNFKLRIGYEVGAMVTLRGDRMWEFLDRLINLAIPRIKDFRGLNMKSFDGRGSYCFGVLEQGVFPEIDMSNVQFSHGMNINIVFRNSNDEMSKMALQELGMPFAKAASGRN